MVGGGSGGHVTPVVAVAREIRRRDSSIEMRFVCDRKFAPQSRELFSQLNSPVSVIVSGKLRRYANLSPMDHVQHLFKTHFRNLIDLFKVGVGLIQSIWKLLWWRPNVVFAKGGFVCLPLGLAAHALRIPIVIHDSDSHPGLTNRILARYATKIGTGAPIEYYPSYPKSRTKFVGIPIRDEFRRLSPAQKHDGKKLFGFDPKRPLVVSIGGGLGAEAINDAVLALAPMLAKKTQILHITGARDYDKISQLDPHIDGYKIVPFQSENVGVLLGCADVVVTRAGATTIAELAAVAATTILVPSPYLAADHQTKNAKIYVDARAAVMVDEREFGKDARLLGGAIVQLLDDAQMRKTLGGDLHKFARPNALSDMVDMIFGVVCI